MGNWFTDSVAKVGNFFSGNGGANVIPLVGVTSAINSWLDLDGSKAAQKQYENQVALDTAAREFSSAESQKQRDWEAQMSNTAYQRAVADMKAAGLNPYMMYAGSAGQVASTPSGSAASGSSGSASRADNKVVMAAGLIATALRMFLAKK